VNVIARTPLPPEPEPAVTEDEATPGVVGLLELAPGLEG